MITIDKNRMAWAELQDDIEGTLSEYNAGDAYAEIIELIRQYCKDRGIEVPE